MQQISSKNVKLVLAGCAVGSLACLVPAAKAETIAYWRFEDGTAGENVQHNGDRGVYAADIPDVSGHGNALSVFDTGGGAGYAYNSNVPQPTVPQTGAVDGLSIKNTGTGPANFNTTLEDWAPTAWTIETTFKVEAGGFRTFIGRDSQGGFTDDTNQDNAALYFQKQGDDSLAIKFQDGAGVFHSAASDADLIQGFDFNTDPDGDTVPWYTAAAVSDGSTLSLYLLDHDATDPAYQLIAQTSLDGSDDTSLSTGHGDGGDWDAGDFSVGRGLFIGGHADRSLGYFDEIRFSDTALTPDQFLFAVPEPGSLALLGLGGLGLLSRRRRRRA